MLVKIKRIDPALPLPEYHSPGAAAFDIYAREDTAIASKSLGLIPTNLIICTPPGYMLAISPRSSTPRKKGLLIPHGIGIIDQDYCGPQDEIYVQVQNVSNAPVTVERGERIAQGLFVKVERAEWHEIGVQGKSRGGFGSTDVFSTLPQNDLFSPASSSGRKR